METLADLVESRLSDQRRSVALDHVSSCARCSGDLSWLRRTTALMRDDAMENAPDAVIVSAVRLFRPAMRPDGILRRIIAILQPTGGPAPAFGLRGTANEQQLLYRAGDYQLDVRVAPARNGWELNGQVFGPAEGDSVAVEGPGGSFTTSLSELQEFAFVLAVAGPYTLRVRVGESEIEIPSLEVGASKPDA